MVSYVFPAGEESKNGQVFLDLLNFLAENQLTRSDLIVALGGGVVGDLAGLRRRKLSPGASASFRSPRPCLPPWIPPWAAKQPLIFPAGKNLAGAFCQPSLVLCDTDTLNSSP